MTRLTVHFCQPPAPGLGLDDALGFQLGAAEAEAQAAAELTADLAARLHGPCERCQADVGSLTVCGGEALCAGCLDAELGSA